MSGLIDMLLNKTRFDQRNTLNNRMADEGIRQPVGVSQQAPSTIVSPGSIGSVDAMIRQRRAARKAQREQEAARFLQATGGQVLPR